MIQVAETFEKQHRNVIQAIEQLIEGVAENPAYSKSPMFYEDTYEHSQNKQKYKMYYMNRDGFYTTFVVLYPHHRN